MADLSELLQAIDASIRSVENTLRTARTVTPQGHRVDMIRSQLEAAREILERAKGFGTAGSGLYPAVGATKPPEKP